MGSWNSLKYTLIYRPYRVNPKVNLFIKSNPIWLPSYSKSQGKFSYKNQSLVWEKISEHIEN